MPMLSLKDAYENAKKLYDQGSYRAAAHASGVLYKQLPHHPPVVALYVGALLRVQRYREGIRIATRSLRHITHKEHRIAIITQLTEGMTQSGQLDEAIELVQKELDNQPDNIALIGSYTHLLVMNNQRAEAIELIDSLRERGIEETVIASVFGRAVLRTDRRDEAIEWIQKLLKENPDTTEARKHQAYNSLGHLLDRAERYDEAMEAFTLSNSMIKPEYIDEQIEHIADAVVANWTKDRIVGIPRPKPFGARPVFIVGMPRSGTTLTEQIIDAHPLGYGAGELGLIPELFKEMANPSFNAYETGPDEYDPEKLAEIAKIYREETASLAGNDALEVIVDKAPMNFNYLGMIALAFPDARIIHCQRDPRDNCLSCFFQLLNAGHAYSFDLENCGKFYRHYRRIMGHYTELLADESIGMPIFENVYEDMVADQEKRTRELLDFIGLEFDPACLNFHKSGRVAITLSNDQVRQPIYKSSTKRYERYAKHIGAMVEALGDVIEDE
jgi:tetratricopeptide (TPR) repeat protein